MNKWMSKQLSSFLLSLSVYLLPWVTSGTQMARLPSWSLQTKSIVPFSHPPGVSRSRQLASLLHRDSASTLQTEAKIPEGRTHCILPAPTAPGTALGPHSRCQDSWFGRREAFGLRGVPQTFAALGHHSYICRSFPDLTVSATFVICAMTAHD